MTSTDPTRAEAFVSVLASRIAPPRTADPDEINASLHEVAVGIGHLGGCRVLANALAVLSGVVAGWPADRRPTDADIAREAGWTIRQDLRPADPEAPTAAALARRIEDAAAGRLVAVPWPWPVLSRLTNALLPGSVALLVGSPGASKSFVLLQAVLFWQAEGWPVALCMLEERADYWLNRALAILSGVGAVTDPDWIARHPDQARAMLADHREAIDALAQRMTCAPPQGMDLRALAEWVEMQAKGGARIIAADPVTAASAGDAKPWRAAEDFMGRAQRACANHGASLLLTSHGRKGPGNAKGPPDLDSLAGGAAFSRFAACVVWLEHMPEPESAVIVDDAGAALNATINRRLRILKARNGRGTGLVLGCDFNGKALSLRECGIIATRPRDGR